MDRIAGQTAAADASLGGSPVDMYTNPIRQTHIFREGCADDIAAQFVQVRPAA